MAADQVLELAASHMNERDFTRLSQLVYSESGISLPLAKKTMLSTRLLKRMHSLHLASFSAYYDYVTSPEGRREELSHMIDVVSTNKTEFFRESAHFDFMQQVLLPQIARQKGRYGHVHVWSAGCSSGEEPYTLAMVLADWTERNAALTFSIVGTDISHRILDRARRAVYDNDTVREVPPHLVRRFFLRGKGDQADLVRVAPEIRAHVDLRWLNLMEPFVGMVQMDVIFCRNVIIYFDRPTQTQLMDKFERQLLPGGYLFLGHSETLNGINGQLKPVRPTIYQKPV